MLISLMIETSCAPNFSREAINIYKECCNQKYSYNSDILSLSYENNYCIIQSILRFPEAHQTVFLVFLNY